ncbi:hypothetical protein [Erwinia amylovora]|uniref:hypothetical protein n=1 Tax=Erwinia amylovora TaxID=552 RepID=UPI0020C064EA|nr:hypothetical protein [Erwinia amylovora]MCK8417638.1 hypothetical protein [Erwinia amylovora]
MNNVYFAEQIQQLIDAAGREFFSLYSEKPVNFYSRNICGDWYIMPDASSDVALISVFSFIKTTPDMAGKLATLYAYDKLASAAESCGILWLIARCREQIRKIRHELSARSDLFYVGIEAPEGFLNFQEMQLKDIALFGDNWVYHDKFKRGNKRFDVFIYEREGTFHIVFRRSYSKKNMEGIKQTFVNHQAFVTVSAAQLRNADLTVQGFGFMAERLTKSDWFIRKTTR